MFRCIMKSLQKSFIIGATAGIESGQQTTKLFVCSLTTGRTPPQTEPPSLENPLDTDEYIIPYRIDQESRRRNNNYVIEALRSRFRLSQKDMQKVLCDEVVHRTFKENFLSRSLEILCKYGINKKTFLECPWLITMEPKRLELKLKDMSAMNFRDINDFAPFLRVTHARLNKLLTSLSREASRVPMGNRIYYISEKLQLPVLTVTKYLSKRLFILEMPFDMLEENLNHMLDYEVSPMNILRDLWAFRYTPKSVKNRLERAKRAKKDKIMPWMVRCPESILQRSFKLSLDESKVLGEKSCAVDYVAERLGFTVKETEAIMSKHPSVFKVRVTKIKEVLDYLLDVEKFTRHEIANVPRIMCHSLETTKQRINELKEVGCRVSSLVIVCKSKREYGKFLKSWINIRNKMTDKTTAE